MDVPKEDNKVHEPSPEEEDGQQDPLDPSVKARRFSVDTAINGAINYARPRPFRIPRPVSQSYPEFRGKQECALKIGIHESFDGELHRSTGISHMEISEDKLTIYEYSQSKLSQQELADLQKATHFDKKELQQWYKGM